MASRVIFHIDVNSAFCIVDGDLSLCLVLGEKTDLREIPSVIAGHKNIPHQHRSRQEHRRKNEDIKTGEPLGMARDKY